MNAGVVLGVDLGTTWTAASVRRSGGAAEPLPLGEHGAAMPSVVAVVDGALVAGTRAVRAAATDPASAAREFKRRLGDTTPIVVAATPYGAETLTGHLLAAVVDAARAAGAEPTEVVLTHPATWGEYKLDLLREAGRVAGLAGVTLVSEPAAAALHYAQLGRLSSGDAVAVYDFGGGTFDAAVVQVTADGPVVLGQPEGLERLGGIDLDQAVVAHVDAVLDGALSQLDTTDPNVRRGVSALRDDCTTAKEALSTDTDTSIAVAVPGLETQVRLTRAELEAAIRPRLAETLGALDRAIASAGLTAADLAGVVLVGGSSRIPLVAELVAAHIGRPLLIDADPKLAVVLGAASPSHRPVAGEEHLMATDTPAPTAQNAGPGKGDGKGDSKPGGAKRTDPSARKPEQSGLSTAGKAAAGVGAAAAAGAAAFIWRDQLMDAVFGGDDAAAAPAPAPADESMDAFDAGPAAGGGGVGGGGVGGGGGAPGVVRTVPAPGAGGGGVGVGGGGAPTATAGAGARVAPTPSPGPADDGAFEGARARLMERLEAWQPPEGADPTEAAALRERLAGLLERYEPRPGQSLQDAVAELRESFELRIENFAQDERLDALAEAEAARQAAEAEEAAAGGAGAATDTPDTTGTDDDTDAETDTDTRPGRPPYYEPNLDPRRLDPRAEAGADDGTKVGVHDDWDAMIQTGAEAAFAAEAAPGAHADATTTAAAPAEPPAEAARPAEPATPAEPAPVPTDDITGAAQVEEAAASDEAEGVMTAPAPDRGDEPGAPDDAEAEAEPEPEPEPEPDFEPEPEPEMADATAGDPLGIGSDDLEPPRDFEPEEPDDDASRPDDDSADHM